jgi:hypothetical protein
MALTQLLEGRFDEFFAATRGDAPLWLLVHVPKTAGSSMVSDLAGMLRPSYNINITKTDPALRHAERLDSAVETFLQSARERRPRFASGHIDGGHLERIMGALPEVRAFAMLRHPVARLVSDYRYQRSPMHSAPEAFRARYPDFDRFVHEHPVHNKITRHLVPKRIMASDNAQDCIDYIVKTYSFIGLQGAYALSFHAITRMIGIEAQPASRKRVNSGDPENVVTLTPELEQTIRAKNALDMAVFAEFSRRYREIGDGLAAYLGRARG